MSINERYGLFARLVAVDGDVVRASRVILQSGWHADSEALARALGDAAARSASERQDPERFAELIVDCLRYARVLRLRAGPAFARAMEPALRPEPVEVRLGLAEWRYLCGGEPHLRS